MARPNALDPYRPQWEPTPAQLNLIAELFIDCGYNTSQSRKAFLKLRFDKAFSDDLTKTQASKVIEELLQQRKQLNSQSGS